jgi:hypothetical protein
MPIKETMTKRSNASTHLTDDDVAGARVMPSSPGSLPYTRVACLKVLGLGPGDDFPEKIAGAYHTSLRRLHPDTGGAGAKGEVAKAQLNAVVHARNMLKAGTFGGGGNGGVYGNKWGGYEPGSRGNPHGYTGHNSSHQTRDPLGLWRFRSLAYRRFAGNVRLGLLVALVGTGTTLGYARATAERRKAERSPRLRAAMGLRQETAIAGADEVD